MKVCRLADHPVEVRCLADHRVKVRRLSAEVLRLVPPFCGGAPCR